MVRRCARKCAICCVRRKHEPSLPGPGLRVFTGRLEHSRFSACQRPRLPLADDVAQQLETRHWFPPAFLPYLAHPAIEAAGRSVVHRLTANHLVHFLDYTTLLEHRIVNRAVEVIVHGELPIDVPPPMKTDALQLYTDEGYHALFSNQVAEQIAGVYGITGRP